MVEPPLRTSKDMREEALAEYGPGPSFLSNGYREFGGSGWHSARCTQEEVGRAAADAEADAEVERLVTQMIPWAPAVAARPGRPARRQPRQDRAAQGRGHEGHLGRAD